MKVLIVAGYQTMNYGSVLQTFATVKMLEKLETESEILNLDQLWPVIKKRKIRFYLLSGDLLFFIKSKGRWCASLLWGKIDQDYGTQFQNRRQKFAAFLRDRIPLTTTVKNWQEATALCRDYDAVMLGSDQLWLPSSVVTDTYTLGFAKDMTTIAFATSFGIGNIRKKYRQSYATMFTHLDFISLRERSGAEIVKEICGKECDVVADPVMMLSKAEWEQAIPYREVEHGKKYIFCYLLGRNRWQREAIRTFADKKGYPVIALIHLDEYITYDEEYFDQTFVDLSPEDFLNYIRNAEFIVTDSYHGTVFSLLENKEFAVLKRFSDHSSVSTNTRISHILSTFALTDRLVSAKSDLDLLEQKICYPSVNERIEKVRRFSFRFLEKALRNEDC